MLDLSNKIMDYLILHGNKNINILKGKSTNKVIEITNRFYMAKLNCLLKQKGFKNILVPIQKTGNNILDIELVIKKITLENSSYLLKISPTYIGYLKVIKSKLNSKITFHKSILNSSTSVDRYIEDLYKILNFDNSLHKLNISSDLLRNKYKPIFKLSMKFTYT